MSSQTREVMNALLSDAFYETACVCKITSIVAGYIEFVFFTAAGSVLGSV